MWNLQSQCQSMVPVGPLQPHSPKLKDVLERIKNWPFKSLLDRKEMPALQNTTNYVSTLGRDNYRISTAKQTLRSFCQSQNSSLHQSSQVEYKHSTITTDRQLPVLLEPEPMLSFEVICAVSRALYLLQEISITGSTQQKCATSLFSPSQFVTVISQGLLGQNSSIT